MFNIKIFDYVSQIVRDFISKHDTKDLEISDVDMKLMFALWCKSINEIQQESPQQWDKNQIEFCKKGAMIAFSKVGGDSVYIPLIRKFVKKLRDSDVFK